MFKTGKQFTLEFEVKKILHENAESRFYIITANILNHDSENQFPKEMRIQGNFNTVHKGDKFEGTGVVQLHKVYGYSIKLTATPTATIPQVKKGLIDFIKKRVSRVGMKTAKKIVDELGLEAISLIEKDYKVLVNIGLTEKRAKSIQNQLVEHKRFEELATFIQSFDLESSVAIRIYEDLGDTSLVKVKGNPYVVCSISKLDFTHADKIAYALGKPSDGVERIKHAILFYIEHRMQSKGDICIFKDELLDSLEEFIVRVGAYPKNQIISVPIQKIDAILQGLFTSGALVTEENNDGKICIYRADYHRIENNIVSGLKELVHSFKTPLCQRHHIDDFIQEYEKAYFPLAEKQAEAVYMALLNGVSILTGGPGTGKTQTTNTIVQCIKKVNPKATILLLAPTGKASKRMTELTNMDASTIHRGLGLNSFGGTKELNQLTSDFIVVDEFSMVDAYLANKLVNNIGENTRILFVGDVDQLPSVGPGLILRDLIDSGKIPVTKLDKVFRQAENSQIVMNSYKVIHGKTTKDPDGISFDHTKGDEYFIQEKNSLVIRKKIIDSIQRMIDKYNYKLDDICLLSPMRIGDLGTDELNRAIQLHFNPPNSSMDYQRDEFTTFRTGDKVIHTENNKDLGVYNGEVGVVSSIYTYEGEFKVDVEYPDREDPVAYSEKDMEQLQLAYAITIHKSQGSEFPIVIMPFHESQLSMSTRNLIYTGRTRAKKILINIGDEETMNKGILKVSDTNRNSRIKEKLQKEL
ncbi:TPA: SF1B family DNA helicase RecD2 [Bacillus cereus]